MRLLLGILYTISGFCLLSFETLWIRSVGLLIGNTVVSATLVIAVFFLCAALGNAVGGRVAAATRRPLALYGACEILTGVSAVLLFLVRGGLYAALPGGWGSALTDTLFVLVLVGIPSFFSGGTFPALSEAWISQADRRTSHGGGFYAGNLVGAAFGVVLGGVLLPFLIGYGAAYYVCAAVLIGVGVVAMAVGRRPAACLPARPADPPAATVPAIPASIGWWVVIGSGILSVALEILTFVYFRQLHTVTIYAVSAVLFAFILDLGLGCWLAVWLRRRGWRAERLLAGALWASGSLMVCYPAIFHLLQKRGLVFPWASLVADNGALMAAAMILLLPLLLAVGAVFPLAWETVERGQAHQGRALGRVVSANKVGCAVGALAASFVCLPALGLTVSFMVVAWCYLGLAALVRLTAGERLPARRLALTAVATLLLVVAAFVWKQPPVSLLPEEHLVALYEGPSGIVATIDHDSGSRHILLNQTYTLNGTGRALRAQKQESWIPLLFHRNPKRVCFIGMASGISAAAALDFPIAELDAVEVVPEVIRAAREQFAPWNRRLFADPRARIVGHDGRHVIRAAREPYDVIMVDLMLPAQDGTASLYSRDFFREVKAKLAAGGLFCLWLPTYQMDEEIAGVVIRTFLDVFPCAVAVRGNFDPLQPIVGLIGSADPIDGSAEFLARRLDGDAVRALAGESTFLRSSANARLLLLGDLVAAKQDFQVYPLNTDDRPAITFLGPKTIPQGRHLRAMPFLNWFGRRFVDRPFPSLLLGDTTREELVAGIRAGNYYFAAAISAVEVPGMNPLKELERLRALREHFKTASALLPDTRVDPSDLRQ